MHAVVAAFCIYAQSGEDAAKRGGWRQCILNGNYIADHGKSWKNHGIVVLNFYGNPDFKTFFNFQKKIKQVVLRRFCLDSTKQMVYRRY